MKNAYFVLIFLSQLICNAQYEKMMLDSNHFYRESYSFNPPTMPSAACNCQVQTSYIKDTIINLKSYKKIKNAYFNCTTPICTFGTGVSNGFYYFREDTILKRLIFLNSNQEKIYYDFNKNIGDTVTIAASITTTITSKDSVLFGDGKYHKRFIGGSGNYTYVEGLGGAYGFLHPFLYTGNGSTHNLICFSKINPPTPLFPVNASSGCNFILVNIKSESESSHSKIYPNPVKDLLNIEFDQIANRRIEVYNSFGELIIVSKTNNLNSEIDLKKYTNGIYLICITENNKRQYLRLLKE